MMLDSLRYRLGFSYNSVAKKAKVKFDIYFKFSLKFIKYFSEIFVLFKFTDCRDIGILWDFSPDNIFNRYTEPLLPANVRSWELVIHN
jgi:hypothetical protein